MGCQAMKKRSLYFNFRLKFISVDARLKGIIHNCGTRRISQASLHKKNHTTFQLVAGRTTDGFVSLVTLSCIMNRPKFHL